MANRAELVQQIRFGLSSLSARNGHHEFETLCREVARQRITPNILPATGPVSAGGDQGRDFETFFSHVTPRLGDTGLLLGLDGAALIAFACTLQRERIEQKVRDDVAAICAEGEPVQTIVFYCEADVPVARRHALQDDIRERDHVRLMIIDGTAISDQLADASLFWVASQYLLIPTELAPTEDAEPGDAYATNLARWRARGDAPQSLGDFLSLREGLREATFTAARRDDIPFWLSRMSLLTDAASPEVSRRARYEVILGTIRGLGHLRGEHETRLAQEFLEAAERDPDPSAQADASVVLMMCVGTALRGLTSLEMDELAGWNRRLLAHVEELRAAAAGIADRCLLLEIIGDLKAEPDLRGLSAPATPVPIDIDGLLAQATRGALAGPGPYPITLVDAAGAIAAWLELIDGLDENPLFPIDGLAGRLGILAAALVDVPGYRELVTRVDEAVARVSGRSAAAERARDRAMTLAAAGRIRDALAELHRARVEWMTGDTIRGSILAQFFAARCYLDLKLPMAARYFWLAGAFLAGRSADLADLIPPSLFAAGDADYESGAWFGSLELFELGFGAQAALTDDPWDTERFKYVSEGLFDLTMIDALGSKLPGPAGDAASTVLEPLGAREMVADELGDSIWWAELTPAELGDRVAQELGHAGFEDGGPERRIAWRALGTEWCIYVANEYRAVVAAEELATVMQVVAAELAGRELLLMPTTVRIKVQLDESGTPLAPEVRPSNDGRDWVVALSVVDPSDGRPERLAAAIDMALKALRDISLLRAEELRDLVREAVTGGLIERFVPMLPYARVLPIDQVRWERSRRADSQVMTPTATIPEHPDLTWRATPGVGYDRTESERLAQTRYEEYRRIMPHSLRELMSDARIRSICDGLRADGWKDWHILQALSSLVMSYRVNLRQPRTFGELQEAQRQQARTPESIDDPRLPRDDVTRESMEMALQHSMLVTIRHWGLDLHQETPDFPALERLLAVRYRYWDDDAPHERWWESPAL